MAKKWESVTWPRNGSFSHGQEMGVFGVARKWVFDVPKKWGSLTWPRNGSFSRGQEMGVFHVAKKWESLAWPRNRTFPCGQEMGVRFDLANKLDTDAAKNERKKVRCG